VTVIEMALIGFLLVDADTGMTSRTRETHQTALVASRTSSDPVRLVDLFPPVTDEDLALIDATTEVVQFTVDPEPAAMERLAPVFAARPQTLLRILCADAEFAYLDRVPDLERLQLHTNERSSLSLAPLAGLSRLRELSLERLAADIDAVGDLTSLEILRLRSITLPDLSIFRRLSRLRRFELRLGGTSDLSGIEAAPLEYLEIWRVLGLADLEPIAALGELDFLFLQALPRVTSLPDLSATRLTGATLDTMKGLFDLSGLAAAPRLTNLALFAMNHIRWEHLKPFAGHPSLRDFVIGTGSLRRNSELEARLRATLTT
jgi:hypothetical protein